MNFLSNENYKLLYEIVTENITNDVDVFNKVFQDFGNLNKNNTEQNDLITYNKQFITLLQTIVHNKPELISQKRKVTFDNKLEEHKQHFLSYSVKTPPPTPNFVDKTDNSNLEHIDALIQQTILKRNYEQITPVHNNNNNNNKPRKIQIQHQLEQDTLTNDAIILDTTINTENDPIANLFSKLQNKINEPINSVVLLDTNIKQPNQTNQTNQNEEIQNYINIIQTNINNILQSFEKIKLLIK